MHISICDVWDVVTYKSILNKICLYPELPNCHHSMKTDWKNVASVCLSLGWFLYFVYTYCLCTQVNIYHTNCTQKEGTNTCMHTYSQTLQLPITRITPTHNTPLISLSLSLSLSPLLFIMLVLAVKAVTIFMSSAVCDGRHSASWTHIKIFRKGLLIHQALWQSTSCHDGVMIDR